MAILDKISDGQHSHTSISDGKNSCDAMVASRDPLVSSMETHCILEVHECRSAFHLPLIPKP